jgi:hypothetical protein
MKGTITPAGFITITWDSKLDFLEAPRGKKYIPCEKCGNVLSVEKNVVSAICNGCRFKGGVTCGGHG